ncbi:MAG: single-stranded DNA-binding protein [Candidatus Omnitrophota bacterium]|nr:single-stranded DNA-binding protein [Candidatus Omnitrophota bacterium]
MASLNKVFLIGNLTRDPELRYTPSGLAVVNLRLAVNRRYKDKNSELKEETCFVTVTAWDKQAEVCNQYLQKGRPVFIEGRLQSRSWETSDGQKRNVLDVKAERIQFLGFGKAEKEASIEPQAGASIEKNKPDLSEDLSWNEEGKIGEKDSQEDSV